jgi:hypothetical protein
VSCEATIGIYDAPVSFEQPTEFEGPAVDVPHPISNLLEPDVLAGTADRDVHPLTTPPNAYVGTDVADFETVRVLKIATDLGKTCRLAIPRCGPLQLNT